MKASDTRPVYFKRLILSNVRSFGDEQHLDMIDDKGRPAQWTLILGENGVGKTTLLQCLASMGPVLAVSTASHEIGTLTAPAPTGVEPALTRRENNELVALARSGEELVHLKVEMVSGQSFVAQKANRAHNFALEANIEVRGGELIDVQQTDAKMRKPIEPLIVGYSAARHMRYGRGETQALHPDASASLFDPSVELADAKDILESLDYAAAKKQRGARALLERIKDALAKLLPDVERASAIMLYGPGTPTSKGQKSGVRVKTPYGEVPLAGC